MGRSQFIAISEGTAEPPQSRPTSDTAVISKPSKRKRWGLGDAELGAPEEPAPNSSKFQNIRLSCSCKYSIKASCFITAAAIIELVGNIYCLAYGVSYIMGAGTFFEQEEQDLNQYAQAQAYEDKFNRVTFLRNNGVGFVALLATCFVGIMVSILMPIGVFWKSWKALRTAMALLFAICIAQIIVAAIFLTTQIIVAVVIAIPIQIYEIHLLRSYIRYYKNKKKRAILDAVDGGLMSPADSQGALGALSNQSVENELGGSLNQSDVTLDLNDGEMNVGDVGRSGNDLDCERNAEELCEKRKARKKSKRGGAGGGNGVTGSISRWRRRGRKGNLSNVQSEELRDMEPK
ncbi:unnamed protein product [Orchesella dallaii]|uniref:Uncharacterized protein n=1 Tax=Orchesella dallaii TaxID=48710 RepID=A0ABP1QRG5_9HEXA